MTGTITIVMDSDSGREHEFEVEFDCDIDETGIGPYEYWGCQCYDHGGDKEISNIEITDIAILGRKHFKRLDLKDLKAVDLDSIEERIETAFEEGRGPFDD